jgi:drug/metabolite transporter (DMT)-like permease
MVAALLLGFSGIAVLSAPVLSSGIQADIWAIIGLLISGLSWSLGTVAQSRFPFHLSTFASAGYQQVVGGIGLLLLAFLVREPFPQPTAEAWWAWGYLWFFGSIVAFTSFVNALRLLPTKIVMTYPYVNPVIAVFMGWLILDETVSTWTIIGAILILLGVAGVFRERYRQRGENEKHK